MAWSGLLSALLLSCYSLSHGQLCCGSFAVQVVDRGCVVSPEATGKTRVTYAIVNPHTGERSASHPMEWRDGYYAMMMWPQSGFEITIEMMGNNMTLRAKNPPDYDFRSYALKSLEFQAGTFLLDEQELTVWLSSGIKAENEGTLKGYTLIPNPFVKPFQERK